MMRETITVSEGVRIKLAGLPDRPGCYLMRDVRGRIVYVGKALSLRSRVRSYFRPATLQRGDPKLRGLVRSVADLEWIVTRSEAEALLTEGQLIKDYRPRYNIDFKDDKRFLLLRVDLRAPFPMAQAVRLRRDDGAAYFGPYPNSAAARAALEFTCRRYGLKRCRPRTPGPADHRHCMDDIVRDCSAPCTGMLAPEAYRARVEEACAFLEGGRPEVLRELGESMRAAAATRDFERAAALRDTLFALREIVGRRLRVAAPQALRVEQAAAALGDLQRHLGLARPPRTIECYDISNISGTLAVASQVCAVDGLPRRARYRHFRIRTVTGSDDPAMMAEVIRRRFAHAVAGVEAPPDMLLVDGGPAQLQAALRELATLGVTGVALAGLAKRFEEIYLPGRTAPLRLAPNDPALQVLQRLRDEAHRFALQYHRRLRARRIQESRLDEIAGVGSHRKQALLTRFGSLQRLARATQAEIAAVPGISEAVARAILECLSDAAKISKPEAP
ncbi:MAG: excinuclease ABC subunit UvrC [bacterium]